MMAEKERQARQKSRPNGSNMLRKLGEPRRTALKQVKEETYMPNSTATGKYPKQPGHVMSRAEYLENNDASMLPRSESPKVCSPLRVNCDLTKGLILLLNILNSDESLSSVRLPPNETCCGVAFACLYSQHSLSGSQ